MTKIPKLEYLSDSRLPSQRANSVHVMQMCQSFSKLGLQTTLYGFKGNGEVHKYYGTRGFEIKHTLIPIRVVGMWLHAIKSAIMAQTNKDSFYFGRSMLSLFILLLLGKKVVLETHNPYSTLKGYQKLIFKRFIRSKNCKGLVVMSNALKNILLSELPELNKSEILAVHDGASISPVSDDALNAYHWPVDLQTERVQVGYVGTISKGRGIELLIGCAKDIPEMDFHVIGGRINDLKKINLEENDVRFQNLYFHGFLSPVDAGIARKKCDILLAPYQREIVINSGKNTAGYMSPLKIFEYMESGKAIVASDLPVLKEILQNYQNSILVNPDNLADWISALRELLDNSNLRIGLGKEAYKDFIDNYTWDKRAERILEFIKKKNK